MILKRHELNELAEWELENEQLKIHFERREEDENQLENRSSESDQYS